MRNNCFSQKEIFFVFPKKLFSINVCIPRIYFSRNVVNSIKCEKNITPPPPPPQTTPPFEIQNQNKRIEDIMDIDSKVLSLSTIWRNHLPFNQ